MKHNTCQLLKNAVLETLEGRQMMSATPLVNVALQNGVLTINSSSNQGAHVVVNSSDNGNQVAVDVDGRHNTFRASQVKTFNITTGNASDYIYIDPGIDIPAKIHSGNGNDVIHGGAGNDSIVAGNGNDVIYGKGGDNTIQVGDGNDTLMGDRGNDTLIAGNGNDSLVGGGGTDQISAGNGNDTFQAGSSHDKITHGSGHNTLIGGLGNTYLFVKSGSSSGGPTSVGTGTVLVRVPAQRAAQPDRPARARPDLRQARARPVLQVVRPAKARPVLQQVQPARVRPAQPVQLDLRPVQPVRALRKVPRAIVAVAHRRFRFLPQRFLLCRQAETWEAPPASSPTW